MEKYFYHLKKKSAIANQLSKLINEGSFVWQQGYDFELVSLEQEIFKEWSLAPVIREFNGRPTLIKIPPMYFYKWHTDATRRSALNLMINETHSHTLFKVDDDRSNYKIVELVYEPGIVCLLNVQEKHCVVNLDTADRYMLSIGFNQSYQTILDHCKAHDL